MISRSLLWIKILEGSSKATNNTHGFGDIIKGKAAFGQEGVHLINGHGRSLRNILHNPIQKPQVKSVGIAHLLAAYVGQMLLAFAQKAHEGEVAAKRRGRDTGTDAV